MAFELVRIPDGTDRRILIGYFSTGQSFCFDDYSRGIPEVVTVVCDHDEYGGEVYVFPAEEFESATPGRIRYKGTNPTASKVNNIEPNTTFEHIRVDKDGGRELTVFKHMAPFVLKVAGLPENLPVPTILKTADPPENSAISMN